MAARKSVIVDCLGGSTRDLSPEENFPANADWAAALECLETAQEDLLQAIAMLEPARLDEKLSNREYSVYFALHGVIQHDIYHAGQIELLKRALAGPT
jgi:uncharacterized damage-inducible protein DinB